MDGGLGALVHREVDLAGVADPDVTLLASQFSVFIAHSVVGAGRASG